MALELSTTRGANDALTTNTPSRASLGGGKSPLDAMLAEILRRRLAASQGPAKGLETAKAAAPKAAPVQAGNQQAWGGGGGAPQQKQEKEITRTIPDPFASPYHKMSTGFDPPSRVERYIPGVGWEFDGAVQGRGSGGGRGTIEGPDNQQQAAGEDPRMKSLVNQQAEAKKKAL